MFKVVAINPVGSRRRRSSEATERLRFRRPLCCSGYMSPEYTMGGMFSEKSDVYSFGVLVLEIVSGKKNTSFHDWDQQLSLIAHAWQLWSEERALELMDEALLAESYSSAEVVRCIEIGLVCVEDIICNFEWSILATKKQNSKQTLQQQLAVK